MAIQEIRNSKESTQRENYARVQNLRLLEKRDNTRNTYLKEYKSSNAELVRKNARQDEERIKSLKQTELEMA